MDRFNRGAEALDVGRLAENIAAFSVRSPFGIELSEQVSDRAALSADDFAFEVVCVLNVGVVALDDDHLRAVEHAVGEVDGLVARFAVRDARHTDVGSARSNGAEHGVELHVPDIKLDAEQVGERFGDIHVPSGRLAVFVEIFERLERRVGRDDQNAGFFDLGGSLTFGAAAAGEAKREAGDDKQGCYDNDRCLFHIISPLWF